MSEDSSPRNKEPEVKRDLLRMALRQSRTAAGLTQNDVASALAWSVSKVSRIEQGAVGITPSDLQALLDVYGIADEEKVAELVDLARDSRSRTWHEYTGVQGSASRAFFADEPATKTIYKYGSTLTPGLFQTKEYARTLLASLGHGEDEIERMLSERLERQKLFDPHPRPELEHVLGEATISPALSGGSEMRAQLERLASLNKGITHQLILLPAHTFPGIDGPFTLSSSGNDDIDNLLYLENSGRETTIHDHEITTEYRQSLLDFINVANSNEDFERRTRSSPSKNRKKKPPQRGK
jgi:transcriptional regulator with XRE-family HTH domain